MNSMNENKTNMDETDAAIHGNQFGEDIKDGANEIETNGNNPLVAIRWDELPETGQTRSRFLSDSSLEADHAQLHLKEHWSIS